MTTEYCSHFPKKSGQPQAPRGGGFWLLQKRGSEEVPLATEADRRFALAAKPVKGHKQANFETISIIHIIHITPLALRHVHKPRYELVLHVLTLLGQACLCLDWYDWLKGGVYYSFGP